MSERKQNARARRLEQQFKEQCAQAVKDAGVLVLPVDPWEEDPLVPDNAKRAAWAKSAPRTFVLETGVDLEDAIADLITDLGHFADRHGIDLGAQVRRGFGMYDEETGGKGAQKL